MIMGSANFIAQIIGLLFCIDAVGVLVNTAFYRRIVEEFIESPALCYLGGILALFFGLFILNFNNAWTADWTVIITIIGWLSVVKGVLLIVFPKVYLNFSNWMRMGDAMMRYIGIIYLLLGLFLTFKGFGLI